MNRIGEKKKIKLFDDLKQSLQEASAHEQGKQRGLQITELPPPPKPLRPS